MNSKLDFYPPLDLSSVFGNKDKNDMFKMTTVSDKSKSSAQHIPLKTLTAQQKSGVFNTSLKEQGPKIARKLGQNEKIFHSEIEKHRCYIYRTFLIKSAIDLYKNMDVVKRGIAEWKALHPLLRCSIVNKKNEQTGVKEMHFAYATEEKLNSLDNIEFLYYASNSSKICNDIWKLLVERETTLTMDGEDSLLYRLTFLQIKNMSATTTGEHRYAVILTYDHAIMDGRSSYNSILQLMTIIENIYSFNYKRPEICTILPPKEDIFKDKLAKKKNQSASRYYYLKGPEFLDRANAFKTSYKKLAYLTPEEEETGTIFTHDHKPFVSLKQLNEFSKNNNSKFRTLLLKPPDLKKLMKKCKENNVKLTTFINMALIMAIRLINKKLDKTETVKNPVNFTTNISLREFEDFQNFTKNNTCNRSEAIGCYISLYYNTFKDNFSFHDYNQWKSEFWRYAQKESETFHKRLKDNDFIGSISLPHEKKTENDFFYHFGNSNLGVLSSNNTENKLIQIKQTYGHSRYSKNNFYCWFTNMIATIDDQLCWTISFNSFTIKQEIIAMVIENLSKIIRELMK